MSEPFPLIDAQVHEDGRVIAWFVPTQLVRCRHHCLIDWETHGIEFTGKVPDDGAGYLVFRFSEPSDPEGLMPNPPRPVTLRGNRFSYNHGLEPQAQSNTP